MPRTIYGPGANEAAFDRNEANHRADAESSHWRQQARSINEPFGVMRRITETTEIPTTNDADRPVRWQPFDTLEITTKTLGQLEPEDSRTFCFKDTALYIVARTQSRPSWRRQLYETIYRRWFPNRAEDTDLSHGNFFCKIMTYHRDERNGEEVPPTSLSEVLSFHTTLCAKLRELIPELPLDVPRRRWVSPERSLILPPAVYKLRPTFEECFVVVRGEWDEHCFATQKNRDRGVVIVFRRAEDAEKHGCGEDDERGIREITDEDLGEARAFRCSSLEIAMQIVLATDARRSGRGSEWHGLYEEWLDPEDTIPMQLCPACSRDEQSRGPPGSMQQAGHQNFLCW